MRLARKDKTIESTATESAVLADFSAALANNRELYLTDVCRQLTDEYLAGPQQQLLGQYLNVKQASTKSIADILQTPCQTKQQAEVIKVLSYFLQGEIDPITTARLLSKLCREQQPFSWKVWRLGDISRAKKLAQFVNNFKAQCVKDIIENYDSSDFVEMDMAFSARSQQQATDVCDKEALSFFYNTTDFVGPKDVTQEEPSLGTTTAFSGDSQLATHSTDAEVAAGNNPRSHYSLSLSDE